MTDAPGRAAKTGPRVHGEIPIGPFRCPLRGDCLADRRPLFGSAEAANEAVRRYQQLSCARRRAAAAGEIFERHLPLVRKTLARFCGARQCFDGSCPVEDLVGEAYAGFRSALDDYEASRGLDFLGFVSQRLYWDLRHRLREQRRAAPALPEPTGAVARPTTVEDRLLARVLIEELVARLEPDEAELVRRRYGQGLSCAEVATHMGLSHAAVRKRLERVRSKLRVFLEPVEA